MSVLVDTNVISDVLHGDPQWLEWSANHLAEFESSLIINPMIYAELSYRAESRRGVDEIIDGFRLRLVELPRDALFLTAQAFKRYRLQGGKKTSPLADFFIGAHAQVLSIPLLTRDIGRYQTYFPKVSLIRPTIND